MKRGRISNAEKEQIQKDYSAGLLLEDLATKYNRPANLIRAITEELIKEAPEQPKKTKLDGFAKKHGFVGMTDQASEIADASRTASNNLNRPHIFVMDPDKPMR